ncbi:MAG: hypothetical protein ACKVS6_13780 [Planctomycetota bacterium]
MGIRANVLAFIIGLLMTANFSGCRAIFLSRNQDVTINADAKTKITINGLPVNPGIVRLDRGKDHILETEFGWKKEIRSKFAWEFVLWAVIASGIFEFLDFTNETQNFLDPDIIDVPPSPVIQIKQ